MLGASPMAKLVKKRAEVIVRAIKVLDRWHADCVCLDHILRLAGNDGRPVSIDDGLGLRMSDAERNEEARLGLQVLRHVLNLSNVEDVGQAVNTKAYRVSSLFVDLLGALEEDDRSALLALLHTTAGTAPLPKARP